MRKILIILMIYYVLFTMELFAWYPANSVLATEFPLLYDFLKPMSFQTVGLKAMGEHFLYLYRSPVDNIFQNPAYLSQNKRRLIYIDMAGEQMKKEPKNPVLPQYYSFENYSGLKKSDVLPYSLPPYTEAPVENEPLISIFYAQKVGGKSKSVGLGFSYEYFHDKLEFYQPYWNWYDGWKYNAVDFYAGLEIVRQNPGQLVDFGNNKLADSGYRINTFFSYDITKSLTAGLRYGKLNKNSNGNFKKINRYTNMVWHDEYTYYDKVRIQQDQKYSMSDLSFGLLWDNNESELGITIGYNLGEINSGYLNMDTTNFISYYFYGPDSINYDENKTHSSSISDKEWHYDGNTLYGNLHGKYDLNTDMTIIWSIYSENRNADLVEEELMTNNSFDKSYNYSISDSSVWNSLNILYATIDRSGRGEYSFIRNRFSIGVDLIVSPKIRFIGGLVIDQRSDKKNADEPLIGRKYSSFEGNVSYEYSSSSWDQNDDKRFLWYRKIINRTVAVPTGLILQVNDHVELQLGVTKIFHNEDINEGYDMIIYHKTVAETVNGTTTTTSDSDYVKSQSYPDIENFENKFLFNAGVSIKYHDSVRITCAIKESPFKPSYVKIGAEFSF